MNGVTLRPNLYSVRIDDVSATVSYIGRALVGTATNTAAWQIMKVEVSGTVTSIKTADSNDKFDNIWDNRTSLTYG